MGYVNPIKTLINTFLITVTNMPLNTIRAIKEAESNAIRSIEVAKKILKKLLNEQGMVLKKKNRKS